ncbi:MULTISPECIES: flavin-containing monooxygenase [Nocardia]|jgi:putative flavoprotein involved in K+ transport|uniref:Putative flavoprotein involved in K+ transport n=2 Tax=Nocardia ignorata TaxID=145285 RepID=A0A4V3CPM5_NOCIG|nr:MULTISPECIES: NAD(P)-binding domain-containing protein [Nocardia]MBC7300918.1 NAD(P)/FAD-dependent oxidoreductase [Nocardia sp.]TDP38532.1 putative flavoprotein involved in K+ transport [Nocardia ignorata]
MHSSYGAVVVGAGQSGLAAAHHLRKRGLSTVVVESGPEPVGSWPHYYESLTLFSPTKYSALPGLEFPGDPDHYPHRNEVVAYLRQYAATLDADIHTSQRVTDVDYDGQLFTAHTDTGQRYTAPRLIAATGGFGTPTIPQLPGQADFTGNILHASRYRSPADFAGQSVIVVGAGNSAVQIATELAETSTVTLASRTPVKFVPQRPFGRDMHFWFTVSGLDTLPVGHLIGDPPTAPVFDSGRYRAALSAGKPLAREMFTGLEADTAIWPDATRCRVDTIILATGYHPNLGYLAGLGALDDTGKPLHRQGASTTHPGLGYLGLEWQRSLSSASLRGVGRDARRLSAHLDTVVSRKSSARNEIRQRR